MLDVFNNSALIKTVYYFLVGLPSSLIKEARKSNPNELSRSMSRMSITFDDDNNVNVKTPRGSFKN